MLQFALEFHPNQFSLKRSSFYRNDEPDVIDMNRNDIVKEVITDGLDDGNNLGAMFYQEAEQSEDVQIGEDMFGFEPSKSSEMMFSGGGVKNEVDVIHDGMRKQMRSQQTSEGFSHAKVGATEVKSPELCMTTGNGDKKSGRKESPPPSQAYISHHPHENTGQPLLDLSHHQQQHPRQQGTHVIHHRPNQELLGYQYQGFPHQHVQLQGNPQNEDGSSIITFQPGYETGGRIYHMYNMEQEQHDGIELQMEEQQKDLQEQHFIQYPAQGGGETKQEMESKEFVVDHEGDGFENFCAPDKSIDDILKGTPGNEKRKMQIEEWIKLV